MTPLLLSDHELRLVRDVFVRHPEVASVTLYGSRAKGTASQRSDVDLALSGELTQLQAEAIADELEDLPLPYHFDVCALKHIRHQPLQERIGRVGICIYSAA